MAHCASHCSGRNCYTASVCPVVNTADAKNHIVKTIVLNAGESYNVGGSGGSFYVVKCGLVLATVHETKRNRDYFSLHGTGNMLNVSQALSSVRVDYSLTALMKTLICEYDVTEDIGFIESDPETLLKIIDSFGDIAASLTSQIWILLGTSVQARVGRFCKVVCEMSKLPPSTDILTIKVTQEQLSRITQAERNSVAASLHFLEAKGAIRHAYGSIVLHVRKVANLEV